MTADQLDRALDELTDGCSDLRGDWPDVLARAGVTQVSVDEQASARKGSPFRARRVMLVTAAVIAGIVVATAFASGLADRFGAWVTGSPGRPAPAGLQQGFEARNRAAYASFPAGTELRLLLSRTVGGTTFSLLGFRNGDAYCLRLVRNDHPNAIGRNECLRADELAGVPALVADDVWFSVGRPATNLSGVYGFASDRVRALDIRRLRGRAERTPVVNNVFLSLGAHPAGSVQHHPLPNPVMSVTALLRNSGARNVPYVTSAGIGGGVVPGGRLPGVPSYFAPPSRQAVPGPSRVEAPIAHPTISWLEKGEPRGRPLPHIPFGHPKFGRVIQPDPDDPVRVGIALGDRGALCDYYFAPLAPRTWGGGCGGWFRTGPLLLGSWYSTPIRHLNGFAADGITRVTAYLASGRVVRAALRDNVFSVAVSASELPGRLVGYDARNRVAGIVDLPGNAVLKPCPTPVFTKPISALPAPAPWERLDLGNLSVNGKQILGMTPAEVVSALGKPTAIRGAAQINNGRRIPEYRYGGRTQAGAGLTITFFNKGDKIYANALRFQSPSLVDVRLGHILRRDPAALQSAIAKTYGRDFRVFLSYGSNPGFGCAAVLPHRGSPHGISLGINPYRPSRPYLTIRANAMSRP